MISHRIRKVGKVPLDQLVQLFTYHEFCLLNLSSSVLHCIDLFCFQWIGKHSFLLGSIKVIVVATALKDFFSFLTTFFEYYFLFWRHLPTYTSRAHRLKCWVFQLNSLPKRFTNLPAKSRRLSSVIKHIHGAHFNHFLFQASSHLDN